MMRKNRNWKDFFAGVLASALIFGLAGTALAATGSKTLEVLYKDIKLVVDGVQVTPKDSNGTVVEPFVANGTTYLPVRALGDALGKKVEWDGTTNTVYVGTRPGGSDSFLQVCPPYQTDGLSVYSGNPQKFFQMVGVKYTEGIACVVQHKEGYALFNLNGAYQTLTFTVGPNDEKEHNSTLYIYLDGNPVKEIEVAAGSMPQNVQLNLNGALQMKFVFSGNNGRRGDGVCIANMVAQ